MLNATFLHMKYQTATHSGLVLNNFCSCVCSYTPLMCVYIFSKTNDCSLNSGTNVLLKHAASYYLLPIQLPSTTDPLCL